MNLFWNNKNVLVTGHTGFKGTWLSLMLNMLGAKVSGYSLEPEYMPNAYRIIDTSSFVDKEALCDIREIEKFKKFFLAVQPEVVFHLAAQPLVRKSYDEPKFTFETNINGTLNLLEILRMYNKPCQVVIITTDKVYENKEWLWGYRENDKLRGFDPYSSSKVCVEMVAEAYRNSYFKKNSNIKSISLATARAGNIIGGGDWAKDRLIPDLIRAYSAKEKLVIRNPESVRPWQHLFDALFGYIILAENLYNPQNHYQDAYNFGPDTDCQRSVKWIVNRLTKYFNVSVNSNEVAQHTVHETKKLSLDSTKAKTTLKWNPQIHIEEALDLTCAWYEAYFSGKNMKEYSFSQINEYFRRINSIET